MHGKRGSIVLKWLIQEEPQLLVSAIRETCNMPHQLIEIICSLIGNKKKIHLPKMISEAELLNLTTISN